MNSGVDASVQTHGKPLILRSVIGSAGIPTVGIGVGIPKSMANCVQGRTLSQRFESGSTHHLDDDSTDNTGLIEDQKN